MLKIDLFNSENIRQEVHLPEVWNEFELEELYYMLQLLNAMLTPEAFVTKLLQYRVSLLDANTLPADWLYKLSIEDAVLELLPIIHLYTASITLTKNPLPQLGSYHGPASEFNDLLVGEFEIADQLINLYVAEDDITYLQEMVASLWRPLDSDGKRIKAKEYTPSEAAKSFFNAIEAEKLHLVYMWWTGCRTHLTELFPLPFSTTTDSTLADQDESIFTDVIHTSAGERNGTRSQIRWETLIKEFMYDIQLQLKKQAEET